MKFFFWLLSDLKYVFSLLLQVTSCKNLLKHVQFIAILFLLSITIVAITKLMRDKSRQMFGFIRLYSTADSLYDPKGFSWIKVSHVDQ